jgi:hypothetical protein
MKAFAQPLSGLIRTGPVADQYGKDWEYLVTWCWVDAITCILFGLKSDGDFTLAHGRAVARAACRLGFRRLIWERAAGEASYTMIADLNDAGAVVRLTRGPAVTLSLTA